MKRLDVVACLWGMWLALVMVSPVQATLYTYNDAAAAWDRNDNADYATPAGWTTIDRLMPPALDDLNHYNYYFWTVRDLSWVSAPDHFTQVNIVFHDIHDWTVEDDMLAVYFRDGGAGDTETGLEKVYDAQGTSRPDWIDLGYTMVDEPWSDPAGWKEPLDPDGPVYDVVYTIEDPGLLAAMHNGGTFVIGLDPDCKYWFDKITIDAPVPEPATIFLVGAGLFFVGRMGRKKLDQMEEG